MTNDTATLYLQATNVGQVIYSTRKHSQSTNPCQVTTHADVRNYPIQGLPIVAAFLATIIAHNRQFSHGSKFLCICADQIHNVTKK